MKSIDDREIVEIITKVSSMTMTNNTANVPEPEIDFPQPQSLERQPY